MPSRFRPIAFVALLGACAQVATPRSVPPDGAPPDDVPAEAAVLRDGADAVATDLPDALDVAATDVAVPHAGYTRCRERECDGITQRCVLCPGSEAVCAPLSGTVPCAREGAVVAYCDGDEDCTGSRRCEWRMGDLFASMICVPTNGRACNGFCGAGCGSACQRDEDCARVACGSRCVSPTSGGEVWPGFGRCR